MGGKSMMLMESNYHKRRGKPQTNPGLLLSSKWNIIVQQVVLIDPDLNSNHQRMVTFSRKFYETYIPFQLPVRKKPSCTGLHRLFKEWDVNLMDDMQFRTGMQPGTKTVSGVVSKSDGFFFGLESPNG